MVSYKRVSYKKIRVVFIKVEVEGNWMERNLYATEAGMVIWKIDFLIF